MIIDTNQAKSNNLDEETEVPFYGMHNRYKIISNNKGVKYVITSDFIYQRNFYVL